MSCFPNDHQVCLSSLNLTPRASDSDTPIPHLSKWVSSSGKSRPIIMDQLPPLHAWCHLGRLQQLQRLLPMHPITSPLEHRRTLLTTLPHTRVHIPHTEAWGDGHSCESMPSKSSTMWARGHPLNPLSKGLLPFRAWSCVSTRCVSLNSPCGCWD